MKTYLFSVIVERDGDEWLATCPALRAVGGATCGRTREEAYKNIQEVVGLIVDSMKAHGEPIPDGPPADVQVIDERVAVMV